jgi:drug/metabolite transporter (DMT)-like permease
MNSTTVYLLALSANLLFSTSSLLFTHYSTRFSPSWMNQTKVMFSILAFGLTLFFIPSETTLKPQIYFYLISSGMLGLCIGDFLLFKAYTTLGAGRSLVLFSFQPLMLGLFAWLSLGQTINQYQTYAVICMILCVLVFVLERNQTIGHWDFKSFFWAFSGITLDAIGVMLTRSAYELDPALQSPMVNLIRCVGALLGFFIFQPRFLIPWSENTRTLTVRSKAIVLVGCFAGTYLSLSLYLTAVKYAHLASLTSIAITGPLWVSLLECLWYRRLPNKFQLIATTFFVIGFYFMSRAS